LKEVSIEIIREKDGSYAIACSSLKVYSVGKTLEEAKNLKKHLNYIFPY